jgi:hypothetical protein
MSSLTTENINGILEGNNKSLLKEVKSGIRTAIKANNKYLENLIGDMANTILNGVQSMFDERDITLKKHTSKLDELSKNMIEVKQEIKFIHQDIKDLEVDFSDKPSRKQFEEFKSSFKNYPVV